MAAENLNVPVDVTDVNNELIAVSNRKRKPNFSSLEVAVITGIFEENRSILTAKLNNIVTNKTKNKLWEDINAAVKAVGVVKRSTHDVKEKWRNLAGTARKKLAFYRKESRNTGGGPPPKKPSETSQKILEFLGETPSFIGVDGFETGKVFSKKLFSQDSLRTTLEFFSPRKTSPFCGCFARRGYASAF